MRFPSSSSSTAFWLSMAFVVSVCCGDAVQKTEDAEAAAITPEMHKNTVDSDTGNWTVGDCIMVQFAMEITLRPNKTNTNETVVIEVPKSAEADQVENCGNKTQELHLMWTDKEKNSSAELQRNFTIQFGRMNDTGYGVQRAYGSFQLAHFSVPDPKRNHTSLNITSVVEIDTKDMPKLSFKVPYHYSFLCGDVGKWNFYEVLKFSNQGGPGEDLQNATVSAKNVRFDAYRDGNSPKLNYQIPMDCDYQPNDIVPVAVGVTLAALVVCVLLAYLFGRRRARQRGYQSV